MTKAVTLPPRESLVLGLIAEAAAHNVPCPTNEALADVLNTSISVPPVIIDRLAARGIVSVVRTKRSRVVTIIATGEKTALPAWDASHWYDPLAELVAEGASIYAAAKELGITYAQARAYWATICKRLGPQAI